MTVSRRFPLLALTLTSGLATSATAQRAQRPFTLDDLGRSSQPLNLVLSPDGRRLAYVVGDTLWVAVARGDSAGAARAVADGMRNQTNYARPFVAWAPDSRRILFRRGRAGPSEAGTPVIADVETGQIAPLVPDSFVATHATFLHWAAGAPAWSPDGRRVAFLATEIPADPGHLALYVTDIASGVTERWATDTLAPFGGIASVAWSPAGDWLAYSTGAFRGTAGRVLLLPQAGPAGPARVVLDTGSAMYRDLAWSPDGRFLAMASHEGRRLTLAVGADGAAMTAGPPRLSRVAGWLHGTPAVFGHLRQGMSARLAVASLGAPAPRFVTGADTLFAAVGTGWSGAADVVSFTAETGELPRDVWSALLTGGATDIAERRRVTHGNAWLDSVALAESRVVRWEAAPGVVLEAQLFLPHGATERPRRPLPVVVLPYGGYVNAFPSAEYFLTAGIELLAQRGYAVVRPNTRGVDTDARTGRYGEVQLADTDRLLDTLIAGGLVDGRRVAVMGHSHGGAMAYYYLTHSTRFCAAVAANGWSDWSEISDRLNATADQLEARLAQSSPLRNAAAVTAPLLAVSGARDTQVLPHNAERMVAALRALGKPAELLAFPDEGHLLEQPASVRMFWTTALGFLDTNCR